MARKARHLDNSTLISITQRSQSGLFRDNTDRDALMEILKSAKAKYGFECYAYCLLDDHIFKLILDTKGRNISTIMSSVLVAYANYRQAEGKLFKGRYLSKPLHNDKELQDELELIHIKTDSQYNSYCFHNRDAKQPDQFSISLDTTAITFGEIDSTLSLEEAQSKLQSWMSAKGCNQDKLKKDKALRNQCIAEFRKSTNCSLKTIGLLFDISESSVSKILK
jgi:REP element-mobilizing transposase RayT